MEDFGATALARRGGAARDRFATSSRRAGPRGLRRSSDSDAPRPRRPATTASPGGMRHRTAGALPRERNARPSSWTRRTSRHAGCQAHWRAERGRDRSHSGKHMGHGTREVGRPVAAGRLAAFLAVLCWSRPLWLPAAALADNPIVTENQQPGTSAWELDQRGDRRRRPDQGLRVGDERQQGRQHRFFVSVNPAQTYTIDVYRMGWYQGLGGRLMQHIGPLDGTRQPTCPIGRHDRDDRVQLAPRLHPADPGRPGRPASTRPSSRTQPATKRDHLRGP